MPSVDITPRGACTRLLNLRTDRFPQRQQMLREQKIQ